MYTGLSVPGGTYDRDHLIDAEAQIAAGIEGAATGEVRTLMADGRNGITLVNIGVGPANAKTICDHIAVLRPEVWLMIGHCGGLRPSQRIGDYVLAHAYLRDDHVLDDVLELAHVAAPWPRLERLDGAPAPPRHRRAGLPVPCPVGLQEMLRQQRDVLRPLPERRNPDRHHRQTMIEVLTKLAFGNQRLEITRRRRNDPHIDGDLGATADALKGLIHQNPQYLVLRFAWQLRNIIDKKRAPVRLLECASLAAIRSVRLIDPEQFKLHTVGGDSGSIDHNKRPACARRLRMERTRRKLLSGARRADNKDPAVGRSNALDRLTQLSDSSGAADKRCRDRRQLLELFDLALEPRIF